MGVYLDLFIPPGWAFNIDLLLHQLWLLGGYLLLLLLLLRLLLLVLKTKWLVVHHWLLYLLPVLHVVTTVWVVGLLSAVILNHMGLIILRLNEGVLVVRV